MRAFCLYFWVAVSGCVGWCGPFANQLYGQDLAAPKWNDSIQRILDFDEIEQELTAGLPDTHHELGRLYAEVGKYEDAVSHLQNALAGPDVQADIQLRMSLSMDLARVYLEIGDFAGAKGLIDQNLKLLEKSPDRTDGHSDLQEDRIMLDLNVDDSNTLALLAEYHRETGDFDAAEGVYRQVLDRAKTQFGEKHRQYSIALHNLGVFLWRKGNYEQAESLLRKELRITESLDSRDIRGHAHSRESLALALTYTGKFDEAETQFLKALESYNTLFGTERAKFRTQNNLGYLYTFLGRHQDALQNLTEATAGRKELLGPNHIVYADSLNDLASLHYSAGDYASAISASREALRITRATIELAAAAQSERQQLAMSSLFRERLDLLLSAASQYPPAASVAFQEILAWKGATLVRQRGMRQLAQHEEIGEQFLKLQKVSMRIASMSRTEPGAHNARRWRATLTEMMFEKEALEANVSRYSSNYRVARQGVTVTTLAKSLPVGCALVDYFEYGSLSTAKGQARFAVQPVMMVSVLKPDGSVKIKQLGPSAPISADIDLWRESLGRLNASHRAGQRLKERIWDPLTSDLEGVETVVLCVDGPLGRFPIGALPGSKGDSYLIEEYRLTQVPVAQLLPSLFKARAGRKLDKHLLLVGDVDYGKVGAEQPTSDQAALLPWERRSTASVRSRFDTFAPLQHTPGEIAFIERLYRKQPWSISSGSVVLDQLVASESRFRQLAPDCYQLHVATHGFFAPADKLSANSLQQDKLGRMPGSTTLQANTFSPGLLSGLAFAGANRPPQQGRDDGILTADEISFLPLDGVELVVLSACETGLGEIAGGEGLIGIQRAFQVAGARTTVASLWQVPDLATRVLMERLYENYWGLKRSRLDALREAQLWVLNNPESVRGVRINNNSEDKRTPPEYWAAFVMSGDWR